MWQAAFGSVLVIATVVPILLWGRLGAVLAVVFAALGVVAAAVWGPEKQSTAGADLPRQRAAGGYVSSDTCRGCHPSQYASWHESYHRTMTQPATPETVAAPMDDVLLESHGRRYHLKRRDGEFRVRMPDPDWEAVLRARGVDLAKVTDYRIAERRIVMTTGSHHYQGYWVPGRFGNMLWQLPFVYHFEDQRWIPREKVFLSPPSDYRHFAIWNANCIQCHAVAGQPRRDPQRNITFSTVAELGIACESCHGPAESHVRRHRNPVARYRQHLDPGPDATIVNPERLSAERSSQVCGQCHAFSFPKDMEQWWESGYSRSYQPGEDLLNSRRLARYRKKMTDPALIEWYGALPGGIDGRFWPDGTVRVGGREYNGMIESACFRDGDGQRQLSCLSCHSMHQSHPNDQLAAGMETNRACTQCHTDPLYTVRLPEHTHHPSDSAGSRCYNCHMPHTSFALLKGIRSHRVDSPRVEISARTGRPNACNLCHLDRTLQWSSRHLSRWYGHPDVELDDEERQVASSLLRLLKGDAAQRAVLAWHFGWEPARQASGADWAPPHLARLLTDPYSAVRQVAWHSLRSAPAYADLDYDFLAPEDERRRVQDEVVRRWSVRNRRKSAPWLLLSADGNLRQKVIDRLLSERDTRPVYIAE